MATLAASRLRLGGAARYVLFADSGAACATACAAVRSSRAIRCARPLGARLASTVQSPRLGGIHLDISARICASKSVRNVHTHILPGLSTRLAITSRVPGGSFQLTQTRTMSTKQRVINTRKRKLAKKAKKPLSSNKSVRQRFRITANGHVKYKRAGMRHFLRNKRPKVKRKLRKGGIFTGGGRRAKQWHKLAKRVAYAYRKKD